MFSAVKVSSTEVVVDGEPHLNKGAVILLKLVGQLFKLKRPWRGAGHSRKPGETQLLQDAHVKIIISLLYQPTS
jgi:hypothetical protein